MRLRKVIKDAIISGPVPKMRSFKDIVDDPDLDHPGELVIAFAGRHLIVPEGIKVGQKLVLEDFQMAFILALFNPDGPHVREAYYSVGRRNGKTFLLAVILLAKICGPLAYKNATLASAAQSRDQAALAFKLMSKMLHLSPDLIDGEDYHIIPSSKTIIGLHENVEYQALSADAKTGYGRALEFVLLDEAGQIKGETSEFVEMLDTSMGSYEKATMVVISTQAPSDADFLSIMLDAAERNNDDSVVAHVYRASADANLTDIKEARKANPGLGIFRSESDLIKQLDTASKIKAKEPSVRNLLLNQRVSLQQLFVGPSTWKKNSGMPDIELFRDTSRKVCLGLDLSARNDLTAAVLAVKDDDGVVHVVPYVFCPVNGIKERGARDRAPYERWVNDGLMVSLGGDVMDYEQIVEYLRDELDDQGIEVNEIRFDRWRIDVFKKQCEDLGAFPWAEWVQVGQGYKDQSPSLENMSNLLAEGRIRHGSHPLLNMSAANAIAVMDPSGNIKIDKAKSTLRIDPLIAMHQAVHGVDEGNIEEQFSVEAIIG